MITIHRITVSACALVVLLLALAPATQAASQRALGFEELVDLSETIIIGRVLSSESRWEGKLIVTVSTINVAEAVKGEFRPQIEILQLGGTAVHPRTNIAMTMTASHHAGLNPDEDVLLFVSRGRSGAYQLVGAQQGKISIRKNSRTDVYEVAIGPKRLEAVPSDEGDRIDSRPMTLDELRERIGKQIRKSQAGGTGR